VVTTPGSSLDLAIAPSPRRHGRVTASAGPRPGRAVGIVHPVEALQVDAPRVTSSSGCIELPQVKSPGPVTSKSCAPYFGSMKTNFGPKLVDWSAEVTEEPQSQRRQE
jgi:hypothetical protein